MSSKGRLFMCPKRERVHAGDGKIALRVKEARCGIQEDMWAPEEGREIMALRHDPKRMHTELFSRSPPMIMATIFIAGVAGG